MRTVLVSPLAKGNDTSTIEQGMHNRELARRLSTMARPFVACDFSEFDWKPDINLDDFIAYTGTNEHKWELARFIRLNNITENDAMLFNFSRFQNIPMNMLALCYLAAFSRPRVAVVSGQAHRWMFGKLFKTDDLPSPPDVYIKLEDYRETLSTRLTDAMRIPA